MCVQKNGFHIYVVIPGFAFPFICMYVPMLLRFSISPNVKRTMYLYVHIKYHT